MAEDENTGIGSAGNDDLRVEVSTLLFELRLAIEATIAGIKRIMTRPAGAAVDGELGILLKLVEQGAESLAMLDDVLERFLRRRATDSSGVS
jgi:hypothetical protein